MKSQIPIIRIDFAYNGTNFKGYQKQENRRTVQGLLEKFLAIIYKQNIELFAAGRTDTGVHAIQQVASFKKPKNIHIPMEKLPYILNALLPFDIRVWNACIENPSFHARFSAKSRTYRYIIHNSKNISPFDFGQKWYYTFPLNAKKMQEALNYLVGEHHFGSFTEKPSNTNLVRTIYSIRVEKEQDIITITIHGNAFLRRMIRIIIGAATTIAGYEDIPAIVMDEILKHQDRNKNPFPTAPPQGLYFFKVDYQS